MLAAALLAAMPLAAGAQQPQNQHGGAKAAPARPAAPAARPAAPAPRSRGAARAPAATHGGATATYGSASYGDAARRACCTHRDTTICAATAWRCPIIIRRRSIALRSKINSASSALQSNVRTRSAPQAQSVQLNNRQQQLNTRQQLRAERTLRRSEDRELRRLPASQRAQRREEIRNAREQRALGRQQVVQPRCDAAECTNIARKPAQRNARITADAARQGRFSSRFAQRAGGVNARDRFAHVAAHERWRHGTACGIRGVVWPGVLALRVFGHFRLRILAIRL